MRKCKECKNEFCKYSDQIGAIYIETSKGINIDYFVCADCLDVKKHYHKLNMRFGWCHLYGDISGCDNEWMKAVISKTLDTVCGEAGYVSLNT